MAQDPRREWLEEAMNRWEKPILRLCYAYLGDRALAEDAVQETFFKAWKHYDRFRGEADEKTWLMRIAMNHCRKARFPSRNGTTPLRVRSCPWNRN